MKRHLLAFFVFCSLAGTAQQQITNSGFELWDNVGSDTEEPQNWNSNKTGTGFAPSGPQTVFRESSIVHSGSYSARIKTGTYLVVFIVNGVMSTGRVNAPSTTASQGYNETLPADTLFNAPLTDRPDSVVFWVNYSPGSGDMGRMQATIHQSYDQNIPASNDANTTANVIADAAIEFGATSGWVRKAVAFDYATYNNSNPEAFILVNFTSSNVPGQGSASSTMYVDDIQLIYNQSGTDVLDKEAAELKSWYHDGNVFMQTNRSWGQDAVVRIFDMQGREVYHRRLHPNVSSETFGLNLDNGAFVVHVHTAGEVWVSKFIAVR